MTEDDVPPSAALGFVAPSVPHRPRRVRWVRRLCRSLRAPSTASGAVGQAVLLRSRYAARFPS